MPGILTPEPGCEGGAWEDNMRRGRIANMKRPQAPRQTSAIPKEEDII
jgi:hypothetical protein